MQARLSKIAEDNNEEFEFDQSTDRVRCAGHKIALVVNAGLQAMGIQAPPPPLVKSTILGEFPLSEHSMTSIPEEDEESQDTVISIDKDQDTEDLEIEDEDENEPLDLPADKVGDSWYDVIEGPFEPPPDQPATNRTEANAVYHLTL
ncbi:hypothetical protein DFH28DRAFT_834744, partial [Melampsora americana]